MLLFYKEIYQYSIDIEAPWKREYSKKDRNIYEKVRNMFLVNFLKGQLHGRAEIFEGLKMTFRANILKKKYTM